MNERTRSIPGGRWVFPKGTGLLASLVLLALTASRPAEAADLRRCAAESDAAPITDRRQAFNAALRDADLPRVEAVLSEDVVLVAGTHSDLFLGREAQLDIWRSEFEEETDRMIYVRTPECVERSDLAPMALEHGHWHGQGPAETFAAGRYTAKWRRVDGEWLLEAEVFMTDRCGGDACPE